MSIWPRLMRSAIDDSQVGPGPTPFTPTSDASSARTSPVAWRGAWPIIALSVYAGAMAMWRRSSAAEGNEITLAFVVACTLLTGAAIAIVVTAACERQLDRRSRRAWQWIAVSLALSAIGTVLSSTYAPSNVASYGTRVTAAGCTLISQVILLLAFLHKPSAPATTNERRIFWLDAAIIAVGGTLAVWYAMHTSSSTLAPVVLFGLSYAGFVVDAALLMLLFVMWQRTALVYTAHTLVAVAAAVCLLSVPHATVTLTSDVSPSASPWLSAASLAGIVVMAVAAWIRQTSAHMPIMRSPAELAWTRALGRVNPFIALAPGFLLVCKVAYDAELAPFAGLIGGAASLLFLAILRQHTSADDTVQARAASSEAHNELRFHALVQHSSDVTTIIDAHGTIRYASPAVVNVLGLDPRRLVGRRLASLLHPDDLEQASQFLATLPPSGDPRRPSNGEAGPRSAEWRVMNVKGEWITVENVATNLLGDPVVQGIVLNTHDVTEQRSFKNQIMHRVSHDPLTDLANRASFLYSLEQALARSQRSLEPLCILILDIDGFRAVNDTIGHSAGDALLREASRRIKACIREGEVMARLDGDEFAVLVEQQASSEAAATIADRIAAAMSRPFHLDEKDAVVSASIGVAFSAVGEGTEDLMRNADLALHVAKGRGRGNIVHFTSAMQTVASERLLLEADLREAVTREEFVVEYQPIVVLQTGEIIGAEALVRWVCRKRGVVSPGVFIPVAEEAGLIVPIGRWVLQRACLTARQWEREHGVPLRITVNLSARQLQDPGIVDDVRKALENSGLNPALLTIELTESSLMTDTALSVERLTALKELGVSLAIDDFGTGYSSLGYLQRYPIDILKIDKSFVDVLQAGAGGPELASVIVALGNTLQMHTVAEGIETELQRERLLALGCELGQGFLFSRPLSNGAFSTLLADRGTTSFAFSRHRSVMSAKAA